MGDLNDSSNDVSNSLSIVGMGLQQAGQQMQAYGQEILGVIGNLAELAITSETSFAKVNSILGLGGKEFQNYKKELKNGANDLGMTYADYADSAYNAISAGVSKENVTSFLSQANQLAEGGLTELEGATDLLTTIQNAYGMTQKDMAHVSDVLIQTQNKGKITVDEMASSMGRVIPIAKSAGVSIEQLGASYAIMTSKGIASSEATTYMGSMFKELNQTGSDVDKALRQVAGGSFPELMAQGKTTGEVLQILSDYAEKSGLKLSDLFGSSEAGSAALTLLSDGAKGFNDQLKNMEESSGLCAKAADEMGKTGDSFEEFQARISNLKSDLGEALLPAINSILDAISPVVDAIRNWAAEHPKIAQTIMVVVAAIGAFLVIGGALTAFIGTLVIAFGAISSAGGILAVVIGALTSPITIVIGIIAGLIAIGVALYQNWDKICAKATELKNWVVGKWNELKAAIAPIIEFIKALVIRKWTEMKASITFVLNIIKGIVIVAWNTIKTTVATILETIKTTISIAWNRIKAVISVTLTVIRMVIANAWNTIKTTISTILNTIKTVVTNIWNGIKTTISTIISTIKSVVVEKWNAIKNAVKIAMDAIKNTAINAFNNVKEKISGVISDIKSAWEGLRNKITNNPIVATVRKVTESLTGAEDGNHAAGLQRVPYNNYLANLHQGEAVLPRREADKWRQGKSDSPQISIVMNGTVIRENADIEKIASALVRKINEQRIITNG